VLSGSPLGSYLAARHAGTQRDAAAAATYYRSALRADPRNSELLERTFLSVVADGDIDTATRLAERSLNVDRNGRLARLVLGVGALKHKRYHNAEPNLVKAVHGPITDLAPTLLGRLGFSYRSKFFGEDLNTQPGGRALLGTYQKVALLKPGSLTILAPGHTVESQILGDKFEMKSTSTVVAKDASHLTEDAQLTVSIYQTASELFAKGLLKLSADAAKPHP